VLVQRVEPQILLDLKALRETLNGIRPCCVVAKGDSSPAKRAKQLAVRQPGYRLGLLRRLGWFGLCLQLGDEQGAGGCLLILTRAPPQNRQNLLSLEESNEVFSGTLILLI